MIKTIKTTICFIAFLFMVSCNNKSNEKYLIGVSQCSIDLWRSTTNEEMLREAAFKLNMELDIRSVEDDSQEQISDIEYFIQKGVDLLVVSPNEAESLTPVIEKAYNAGIPVILFDRKINSDAYSAYVGADNFQIGSQIGMYINNYLPGHTRMIIIRGTEGSTSDKDRYEGLINALTKYSDNNKYEILAEPYANYILSDAKIEMQNVLRNIPVNNIDLIVAFNDQMAMGAHLALREVGSKYMPFITGVDALSGPGGGLEMITNGTIGASFIYPTGGETIIELAEQILQGKPFSRENYLNTAAIDETNVRVISLQRMQISDQQHKFDALNNKFALINKQANDQRQSIIFILIVCLLSIALAGLLFWFNRRKNRYNEELHDQYLQIQQQIKELELQRSQSVALAKQLEESTQAKLVFFTNISHEFKTPLSLIVRPVEELLKSDNLTVQQRNTLEIVMRNSNKLLSLITEILDFRSYENGRMKLDNRIGDLKNYLFEINNLFSNQLKFKKLNFSFECDDNDYYVLLDFGKMEKVYFNLLSNAFKYVPEGGFINIKLTSTVETINICVFNSGSYIPKDKVDDIFQRFYKLDTSINSSGIGLALTL